MCVKILFKERLLKEFLVSGWGRWVCVAEAHGVRKCVVQSSVQLQFGQVLFSSVKWGYYICSTALQSCCERRVVCITGSCEVLIRREVFLFCFWDLNAGDHLGTLFIMLSHSFHTELTSTLLEPQTLVPTPTRFSPSFPVFNQTTKASFPFLPFLFVPSSITGIITASLDATAGVSRAHRGSLPPSPRSSALQAGVLCKWIRHHCPILIPSPPNVSPLLQSKLILIVAFHFAGAFLQCAFPPLCSLYLVGFQSLVPSLKPSSAAQAVAIPPSL